MMILIDEFKQELKAFKEAGFKPLAIAMIEGNPLVAFESDDEVTRFITKFKIQGFTLDAFQANVKSYVSVHDAATDKPFAVSFLGEED